MHCLRFHTYIYIYIFILCFKMFERSLSLNNNWAQYCEYVGFVALSFTFRLIVVAVVVVGVVDICVRLVQFSSSVVYTCTMIRMLKLKQKYTVPQSEWVNGYNTHGEMWREWNRLCALMTFDIYNIYSSIISWIICFSKIQHRIESSLKNIVYILNMESYREEERASTSFKYVLMLWK